MKNAFFVLIAFIVLPISVWAADMYSVNIGATVQITEHSVCQRVTNNHASGRPIMVPTRTATEWTTFRNNRPAGVSLAACPPACSGVSIGGYCWYLGAESQSCTQVCAARGGVNLAGTRNYAGTGGTNAQCSSILSAFGYAGSVGTNCNSGATAAACGCWLNTGFSGQATHVRCTVATTTAECGPGIVRVRRACACNN